MKIVCLACGTEFKGYAPRKYCGRPCAIKMHPPKAPRHGLSLSPEHDAWRDMKTRCFNPANKSYPRYGGRGITVCERWMSFENFLEDMGMKPGKGYSIERVDNDRNYEPENCRWATQLEQSRNRNCCYTADQDRAVIDGLSRGLNAAQIAKLVGKTAGSVDARIRRQGLKLQQQHRQEVKP